MKKVYVFLADGFEEIEGLTVVDVLRGAGADTETVSVMGRKEIRGSHEIQILADSLFEDVDFSDARLLVLASKDATFSAADIIDTIETGDCSLAYQIYKMDLSSWSRQLHFALVLNNPQMDFNIDNACWFVIDSVRIHYTEGTPCLPVEEVDQPVGGINLV